MHGRQKNKSLTVQPKAHIHAATQIDNDYAGKTDQTADDFFPGQLLLLK